MFSRYLLSLSVKAHIVEHCWFISSFYGSLYVDLLPVTCSGSLLRHMLFAAISAEFISPIARVQLSLNQTEFTSVGRDTEKEIHIFHETVFFSQLRNSLLYLYTVRTNVYIVHSAHILPMCRSQCNHTARAKSLCCNLLITVLISWQWDISAQQIHYFLLVV